jgi:LysR family nitrogen assimilation transcriptional regulator
MDIRQLRTFVHVAELGSFSKAADRLHIAQPALSRQIRMLEAELKAELLVRHGRGVTLTGAGAVLLDRAAGILRQIEQARADVAAEAGDVAGQVSFGMPPSVGFVLAGPLAEDFRRTCPKVKLKIVEGVGAFVHEWMLGGRLDVGVLYQPGPSRHLETTPLWHEDLYLFAAAGAGLDPSRPVPLASLSHHPLILPSPGHGLRGLLERHAARHEIELHVEIEADATRIQKDLAARGLGYSVLPFASVAAEVRDGLLSAAPITAPAIPRRVVLAYPADRPVSRAARLLGERLISVVRGMLADNAWPGMVPEASALAGNRPEPVTPPARR